MNETLFGGRRMTLCRDCSHPVRPVDVLCPRCGTRGAWLRSVRVDPVRMLAVLAGASATVAAWVMVFQKFGG